MPTHADVPGDLLFGLLSLQSGLIDQTALVAAFHAWTHDKAGRSMADILIAQGALTDEEPGLVAALVSAHLRRHGGDREGSLADLAVDPSTIDGLADLHDPDLEATISKVGLAVTRVDGNGKTAAPPVVHARYPTTIDGSEADLSGTCEFRWSQPPLVGERYRILRRHDAGGLGVIYVALDTVLNREVALKRVRPEKGGDSQSRTRLLLEAEITAGLEHPGIIPVHDLGLGTDGHPFYVMRFIKGKPRTEGEPHDEDNTLKAAIAAFHDDATLRDDPAARMLELQKLLRRFLDVCNAVEYAHARGVLHRDLKPSNVVLGKHGETLVIDWGLAKAVGRSGGSSAMDERTLVPTSGSDSADTQPGFPFGTLPYMPGEQAEGNLDKIGTRSDVYSLGATLYTILTGRKAFDGPNQAQILAEVKAGQFPPPRLLDPTVDRALEAVCLKAMEREPEDRYPSPRALAEDIERWLADAPVSAWREPASVRLRRWSRRHRPLVAAAVVVLMMSTLASAGAAVLIYVHEQNLLREQKKTELARAEADAFFFKSLDAGNAMLTRVFDEKLANVPQMEQVRKDVAVDAADFFNGFLRMRPGNSTARHTAAKVFRRAANMDRQLNKPEPAKRRYEQSVELLEELRREFTGQPVYREELVETLIDEAEFYRILGRPRQAEPLCRKAVELAHELQSAQPGSDRYRRSESTSLFALGAALAEICQRGEGRKMLEQSAALRRPFADAKESQATDTLLLVLALVNLAEAQLDDGLVGDATRSTEEAVRRARELRQKDLNDPNRRFVLVAALRLQALVLAAEPARIAEADRTIGEAVVLIEQLPTSFPRTPSYRHRYARAIADRGDIRGVAGRHDDANADRTHARSLLDDLVKANPETPDYRKTRGLVLASMGKHALTQNKPDEASRLVEAARADINLYMEANPDDCKLSALKDQLKALNVSAGPHD